MNNKSGIFLVRIRLYNPIYLISYMLMRWRIFLIEDKRRLLSEFTHLDLIAQHYLLFKNNEEIGAIRLLYKDHIANISRVMIIRKYRKKGYGTELVRKVITLIKDENKVSKIKLYTAEGPLVEFYERFGFITHEKSYYNNAPCVSMIKLI